MVSLAIQILWLAIGILVVLGAIYLLLMVIKVWATIDPKIETTIWLIALILCIIGGLTLLNGGAFNTSHVLLH